MATLSLKALAAGLALVTVAAAVLQAVNAVVAQDALSRLRSVAGAAQSVGMELPTARMVVVRDLAATATALAAVALIALAVLAAAATARPTGSDPSKGDGGGGEQLQQPPPAQSRALTSVGGETQPPQDGARTNSESSTTRSHRSQLCFNPLSVDHMDTAAAAAADDAARGTDKAQHQRRNRRQNAKDGQHLPASSDAAPTLRESDRSPLMVVHSDDGDHGGVSSPLAISSSDDDVVVFNGSPTRVMGATTRPRRGSDSRRMRHQRATAGSAAGSGGSSPASPEMTVLANTSAGRTRLAVFDTSVEAPLLIRRADTGMSSVAPTTPMLRQNTITMPRVGPGASGGERYSESYTPSNTDAGGGHGWEVTPDRYRSVVLCAKLHMPSVQAVSVDIIRTFHARMSQVARQLNTQLRAQHFCAALSRREADCVVLVLRRSDEAMPSPSAAVQLDHAAVHTIVEAALSITDDPLDPADSFARVVALEVGFLTSILSPSGTRIFAGEAVDTAMALVDLGPVIQCASLATEGFVREFGLRRALADATCTPAEAVMAAPIDFLAVPDKLVGGSGQNRGGEGPRIHHIFLENVDSDAMLPALRDWLDQYDAFVSLVAAGDPDAADAAGAALLLDVATPISMKGQVARLRDAAQLGRRGEHWRFVRTAASWVREVTGGGKSVSRPPSSLLHASSSPPRPASSSGRRSASPTWATGSGHTRRSVGGHQPPPPQQQQQPTQGGHSTPQGGISPGSLLGRSGLSPNALLGTDRKVSYSELGRSMLMRATTYGRLAVGARSPPPSDLLGPASATAGDEGEMFTVSLSNQLHGERREAGRVASMMMHVGQPASPPTATAGLTDGLSPPPTGAGGEADRPPANRSPEPLSLPVPRGFVAGGAFSAGRSISFAAGLSRSTSLAGGAAALGLSTRRSMAAVDRLGSLPRLMRRDTAHHGDLLMRQLHDALERDRLAFAATAGGAAAGASSGGSHAGFGGLHAVTSEGFIECDLSDDENDAAVTAATLPPLSVVDQWHARWCRSEHLLGQGATANVYLGMREDTGEFVAVKCVPLAFFKGDDDALRAFGSEVKTLTSLTAHRNIVQYRSFVVTDNNWAVIIMEYVSGGTLSSVAESFGALPEPVVVRYLRDVLSGLAYLHSQGIMHRDVKPQNVLVGLDGTCKLSDFGTVHNPDDGEQEQGVAKGSPLYMAPEQARGSADLASDIWGVGLIAVTLLTGDLPYETQTLRGMEHYSLVLAIGTHRVRPRHEDVGSEAMRDFLSHCFAGEPADRFTAAEALQHRIFTSPAGSGGPPPILS